MELSIFSKINKVAMIAGIVALTGAYTNVEAATLSVEQSSSINQYGKWTLTKPNSSILMGDEMSSKLTNLAAGSYKLQVLPPNYAQTIMTLIRNGEIKYTSDVRAVQFNLADTDEATVVISFEYGGIIEVTSNPPGAKFELQSGSQGNRVIGTTPETYTEMPPMPYFVAFERMENCHAPKTQRRTVEANGTAKFHAEYNCDTKEEEIEEEVIDESEDDNEAIEIASGNRANIKIWNECHQTESLPGNTVFVTVGIRNVSKKTVNNVKVTESFNPDHISVPVNGLKGGKTDNRMIVWNIPQIFAGQSWSKTFPVVINKNLSTGDKIQMISHVSGNEVWPPELELMSESIEMGIASMPKTGGVMSKNISLLIGIASLLLTLTIRRKSLVESTVQK